MSVISTRDLGIRYSVMRHRGRSLKRTIFQFLTRELKRSEFWALRNVTLEIGLADASTDVGLGDFDRRLVIDGDVRDDADLLNRTAARRVVKRRGQAQTFTALERVDRLYRALPSSR